MDGELLLVEVFSKPTGRPDKRVLVVRAYMLPDPETARRLVEERNTMLAVVEREMEIGPCRGDEEVVAEDVDYPYQDVVLVLHSDGVCFKPLQT